MQYAPSLNLSKYIKHYLIFEIPEKGNIQYRHFSNGHNGLVFTLKKKEFISLNSKNALPETFIFGQISENQDFHICGTTSLVVVLFQPFGFYGLTGIYSGKFFNAVEDAHLIFGDEISELWECLHFSSSAIEAIGYLNAFFTKKLSEDNYALDPYLLNALKFAYGKKGNTSVNELCIQTGINERKIQRLFSQHIGISPKKFIRNIKLHSFLGLLRNERGLTSLTDLSLRAGYYDQAHLIKEFKKTIGINPSKYLKTKRLAVNLIEF